MRFIFILLLNLLLLNISCNYIIGKDEEIKITDKSKEGTIYIKLDNFINASYIYVKLEVDEGTIYDYIDIKFNNSPTEEPDGFSKERYYSQEKAWNSYTNYYKISYKKYNYSVNTLLASLY